MWNGNKVSVILPTYNEEENIVSAVNDFLSCKAVDELVVVNNNSTDRTAELVKNTKATLLNETKQGYGFALRRGLQEATGDYVVLSEPDGTFEAKDIYKLLSYAEDFDLVLGTRTACTCIWPGANMGLFIKLGNYFVAKLLENLFNGPSITDVGCTMRLIKRETLEKIKNKFTVGKSHFLPEMVILAILEKSQIIEIPLHYRPRRGHSKITGNKIKAIVLGFKMILLIIGYRLITLFVK
jgi:glycosyltransferase involved in cell wall biosynthesis